jgi:ESS family glutamate:Na+ symporter
MCETGYWVNPRHAEYGCVLGSGGAQGMMLSYASLALLLMLGKLTRIYASCLHFLYLPSCVIGGVYGVVVLQTLPTEIGARLDVYWTSGWSNLPEFLINIVFAGLFLGSPIPHVTQVWRESGPNLTYGMVTAWIQMLTGFVLTWALLVPVWGVNELFGQTLPIGFAGGHGSAAALGRAFTDAGYPDGGTIALGSATVGIVSGERLSSGSLPALFRLSSGSLPALCRLSAGSLSAGSLTRLSNGSLTALY